MSKKQATNIPYIPGLVLDGNESKDKPGSGSKGKKKNKKNKKNKNKQKAQTQKQQTAEKPPVQSDSDSDNYHSAEEDDGTRGSQSACADDRFVDAPEPPATKQSLHPSRGIQDTVMETNNDTYSKPERAAEAEVEKNAPAPDTCGSPTANSANQAPAEVASQPQMDVVSAVKSSEKPPELRNEDSNALQQLGDYGSDMDVDESDGTQVADDVTQVADDVTQVADETIEDDVSTRSGTHASSSSPHTGQYHGETSKRRNKKKNKKRSSRWEDATGSPDKSKRTGDAAALPVGMSRQQNLPVGMAPSTSTQHKTDDRKSVDGPSQQSVGGAMNSTDSVGSPRDDPLRQIADLMTTYIRNPRKYRLDAYQGCVYMHELANVVQQPEDVLQQVADRFDEEFTYHSDEQGLVNIGLKGSGGRRQWGADEKLSRALSSLLRHRGSKDGFTFQPGGFLFVDEILQRPPFAGNSVEAVQRIVANNDKQRFSLQQDDVTGRLMIRANQGHSIRELHAEALGLPEVCVKEVACCVHGTYYDSWRVIQKSGLRPMSRNEIHFAIGEPGDDGVISGMRASCDVLIFLDIDRAITDGIKFYRSANDVILSRGSERGVIPPRYFKSVIDRQSRKSLLSAAPEVTARRDSDAGKSGPRGGARDRVHSNERGNSNRGQGNHGQGSQGHDRQGHGDQRQGSNRHGNHGGARDRQSHRWNDEYNNRSGQGKNNR